MASFETVRQLELHPEWLPPRSDLRVFLGEPGAPEATKTTVEPGNAFSPGMMTFGVTWWLRLPGNGSLFCAGVRSRYPSWPGRTCEGYLPAIQCQVDVRRPAGQPPGLPGRQTDRILRGDRRPAAAGQPDRPDARCAGLPGAALAWTGRRPAATVGVGQGRLQPVGRNPPPAADGDGPTAQRGGRGGGRPLDPGPDRCGSQPDVAEPIRPAGVTGCCATTCAWRPDESWSVAIDCPHQTYGTLASELPIRRSGAARSL